MTAASNKTICVVCNKIRITYVCQGCSEHFCLDHLPEHRKNLAQQLDHIENDHDEFRQNFNEQKSNSTRHPLIKEINQWEIDSITKIKQIADRCREKLIKYANDCLLGPEKKLNNLAEQIKEMRHENEFNEIDLKHLKHVLEQIQEEFLQPPDVSIKQQPKALINLISLRIPFQKDTRWKQHGITVAGGNGQGNRLNQLSLPLGICIDNNDQTIYVADCCNARIMEWKTHARDGRIVAGGNGVGDQINQLNSPADVIIDKETNSLIIADKGNRRVMRWSRHISLHGQIIISNIDCSGLTMHEDGTLYVSDWKKNEVRRWKRGEANGTVVAGVNGEGSRLNQLHGPTFLFVDDNHALYVSDSDNQRVMKWMTDSKEGIVEASKNAEVYRTTQLSCPAGVMVNQFGQILVTDAGNARTMLWCEKAKEGRIVIGGDGRGKEANQLDGPRGLSLDDEGNLYVVDSWNHRVQKFVID